MKRIDKNNYYLDMAEAALERSTCLRRKWGCVIVKDDEIIATGYNGAPRGRKNCSDIGKDMNYVEVYMLNKMLLYLLLEKI